MITHLLFPEKNITFIASCPFVTAVPLKRQAAIRLLDFTILESLMLERNLRATYAGTEVIRAKHHAVMVETSPGSKSTDFLTHCLKKICIYRLSKRDTDAKRERKMSDRWTEMLPSKYRCPPITHSCSNNLDFWTSSPAWILTNSFLSTMTNITWATKYAPCRRAYCTEI